MLANDLINVLKDLFRRINLVIENILKFHPTKTFELGPES
jgi:hypothetical protein